jgi:hypothetical protein
MRARAGDRTPVTIARYLVCRSVAPESSATASVHRLRSYGTSGISSSSFHVPAGCEKAGSVGIRHAASWHGQTAGSRHRTVWFRTECTKSLRYFAGLPACNVKNAGRIFVRTILCRLNPAANEDRSGVLHGSTHVMAANSSELCASVLAAQTHSSCAGVVEAATQISTPEALAGLPRVTSLIAARPSCTPRAAGRRPARLRRRAGKGGRS